MTRLRRTCRLAFAGCLWLGMLSGCAAANQQGMFLGFFPNRKQADEPQVETPAERIAALRKLAASAERGDAAERERIAAQLASAARSENDPLVRAQLMRTLGHYSTPQAVSAVALGLQDAQSDVRIAACEALATLRVPEATELLSKTIAGDTDPDVRLAALRAAGELDDPRVVPGIAVALDDPDPALQYRAIRSLEHVTGKYYGDDVALWREYAAGGSPVPPSLSVAQRLRRLF